MLILDYSYGLRRYMEEGMLQPDGRVIFPIKLPKREIITNSTSGLDSATPRTTILSKEIDPGTARGMMNGWLSVMCSALIPISLGIVAVFAKEAISILRRPGRR